jgi:hypothetical protein
MESDADDLNLGFGAGQAHVYELLKLQQLRAFCI